MEYTVKEIAARLEMSEHTVRYYTDQGLIPGVRRDANNNRLFDESAANWLTGVKCLRACGMPVAAVREYCRLCLEGEATAEARYQIILEQKAVAEAQLEEAKKRVDYLEHKAALYRESLAPGRRDVMNPGTWAGEAL